MYSDGSRVNNSSGYGYLVKQGRVVVTEGKGAAGRRTEVYDAEIMRAAAGLEAAVNSPAANLASGITVWLDNHAAASLLADGRTAPSRPIECELFRSLKRQWEVTPGLLSKDSVKVRWPPDMPTLKAMKELTSLPRREPHSPTVMIHRRKRFCSVKPSSGKLQNRRDGGSQRPRLRTDTLDSPSIPEEAAIWSSDFRDRYTAAFLQPGLVTVTSKPITTASTTSARRGTAPAAAPSPRFTSSSAARPNAAGKAGRSPDAVAQKPP